MTKSTLHLKKWQFKNQKETNWLNTTIPSTVHMDLFHNGLIFHPYEEMNEKDLQWIDKENWVYRTQFTIETETYNEDFIEIVFEGLDTISSLYINDQLLLETDNMFRRWKKDIKSYIHEGMNEIKIIFHSPIQYGLDELAHTEYILPATMDDSGMGGIGEKKVSMYLRKAPYHFGWDWGPRFVTSGIWREARIEAWSDIEIEDLYIEQKSITKEKAEVIIHSSIQSHTNQTIEYIVTADDDKIETTLTLKEGLNELSFPMTLLNPKLWWTYDLGEPSLTLFNIDIKSNLGRKVSKTVTTGLRSIELVQDDDKEGRSFYFKLNGTPIFAKGANHIPLDSFIPEISSERYRTEIEHAKNANMNMLRVWGGGIYEEDIFYDLCDEQGILVWQDFMFSCSMYPGTKKFLRNVSLEAEDNIKRLRNHPSIALWCGNNEIDSMWKEFTDQTYLKWKEAYSPEIRKKVWEAYDTIFHKLLPEKINELMPEIDYWPSSPMNELSYSKTQHASLNNSKGDIHLWNVWHSDAPIEDYNNYIGRFMSEYGFQSFPSKETFKKITTDQNLSLDSKVVAFHQKNKSGNRILNKYLNRYYRQPKDFDGFIHLSQFLQGYAFETAIRAHRRSMPYCMGTLYWQLNDSWPGASWSTIDYFGNKKCSHFNVKEAFKKTILAYDNEDVKLNIYGVTDERTDLNLDLTIQIYSLKQNCFIEKITTPVLLNKNSSTLLYSINKKKLFEKYDMKDIFILSELKKDLLTIDTYHVSFVPLKEIDLTTPTINSRAEIKDHLITYNLKSDAFAKSVVFSLDLEGEFESNCIDIFPDKEIEITFKAKNSIEKNRLPNLKYKSMIDFIR